MAADPHYFHPQEDRPEMCAKCGEGRHGLAPAYDATEQDVVLQVFGKMLRAATGDGGRKRAAGLKPPWWRDESHEAAVFSHLNKWKHGEKVDRDSGVHPLVHLAWRALAIAYQEMDGRVDPATSGRRCVFCRALLDGHFYGAGDGSGQRFQCPECFKTREAA